MLDYVEQDHRARPHASAPTTTRGCAATASTTAAILQITLIASWFNYINRVADALGGGKGLAASAQRGGASQGGFGGSARACDGMRRARCAFSIDKRVAPG